MCVIDIVVGDVKSEEVENSVSLVSNVLAEQVDFEHLNDPDVRRAVAKALGQIDYDNTEQQSAGNENIAKSSSSWVILCRLRVFVGPL